MNNDDIPLDTSRLIALVDLFDAMAPVSQPQDLAPMNVEWILEGLIDEILKPDDDFNFMLMQSLTTTWLRSDPATRRQVFTGMIRRALHLREILLDPRGKRLDQLLAAFLRAELTGPSDGPPFCA